MEASSSEIRSSNSECQGGLASRHDMESTKEDGGSTITSAQPQQIFLRQRQGNIDNSREIQLSDSHLIEVGGDECSTASSPQFHQPSVVSHQESGNMENSPEIQSSNPAIQEKSAGGDCDSAVSSAQVPEASCRQVSVEDRKNYLKLYEAAKDGKWKAAKKILDRDRNLLRADLTNRKETILHVATQANQAAFVWQLLEYLNEDEKRAYLELEDMHDNTAFLFAVASGNMEIVDIMGEKNPELRIRTGHQKQLTPLHVAALQEHSEMARYLYEKTVDQFEYTYDALKSLLFLCVNAGIYDLALKLLEKKPDLAFERDYKEETILNILSQKPLGLKQTQQYKLVMYLWNEIFLKLHHEEIMEKISGPPHVVFDAVKVGNFKFLELLISTYPYLTWEVDKERRSIIHNAVLNRQADIFNFTRDIGSIKDIIVRYTDSDESNLLHMAATMPSKDRLNLVFGPAFQMTLELLWFEAVQKIVPPSFIEMKNSKGFTPGKVFTETHKDLVDKAQSWTEKTTHCCMVVSTLITTGVFTATFSIPGGVEDNSGSPHYLVDEKKLFTIFSIFDAIAMISSSTSIFIFLSILISRHAEYDFQYKSLPMKLIFGLITLLISIISMMISFSSAFIMYFSTKSQSHGSHHNGLKWVPIFICVLAFIPITIFVYQLWPLWSDIAKLTKFSWNLSQPRKNMLLSKKCSC